MTLSEQLMSHVEGLQRKADSSLDLYPEDATVLPNDAVYLMRVMNLKKVLGMVEDMVDAGHDLSKVLKLSIEPNLNKICSVYPYTEQPLKAIIRDFA